MELSDFDFELPEELIAQHPSEKRDESRLIVLDRSKRTIEHKIFKDIIDYLQPGDCLVRNNTKVIPARLYGIKEETGANVEFLLLKRIDRDIWEVMVKPGKKLMPGVRAKFGNGLLKAEIIEKLGDGNRKVKCDVAFVPVGGTYTMNYSEAAELVNIIKPKIAVPIHYGSVVGTKQDATDFIKLLHPSIKGIILMKQLQIMKLNV